MARINVYLSVHFYPPPILFKQSSNLGQYHSGTKHRKKDEYLCSEEDTHAVRTPTCRLCNMHICCPLPLTVSVWCSAAVPHLPSSWPASSWCCWPLTYLRAQSLQRWSSPSWFSLALLQWYALPESSCLPVLLRQTNMTEERTCFVKVYHYM